MRCSLDRRGSFSVLRDTGLSATSIRDAAAPTTSHIGSMTVVNWLLCDPPG